MPWLQMIYSLDFIVYDATDEKGQDGQNKEFENSLHSK